jgi:hypothetical protein
MPDTYHTPLSIDVFLPRVNNNLNYKFSYRIFPTGNYTVLYNILSAYDWSMVYETFPVDVAVTSHNAFLRDVMKEAILRGSNCKSKFPPWFFYTSKYHIDKRYYFRRRFKKRRSDCF